jgi:hypothetical protein
VNERGDHRNGEAEAYASKAGSSKADKTASWSRGVNPDPDPWDWGITIHWGKILLVLAIGMIVLAFIVYKL